MGCGVSKQRRVVVEQSLDAASPSVIVVKAADSPTATPVDAEFPHNHPVCTVDSWVCGGDHGGRPYHACRF